MQEGHMEGICKNCGADTFKTPHKPNCPVGQSILKCRELGIPWKPEDYELPLRLNPG